MKTSAFILALATFALADVLEERDSTTSTVSAGPTTTYSLSPQATCLAACNAGDVTCEAACVGAAHPNSVQVNQTDDCVANCPQGDGSKSASDNYSQCVSGCIASYYPTSQTAAPVSVGSETTTSVSAGETTSSTGTKTGSAVTTTSGSGTAAGSTTTASPTKNAGANNAPYIVSVGGLAGLFVAFFTL